MNKLDQIVGHPILTAKQVAMTVRREDRIHPRISGNKYRKLKYNLESAKALGHSTILTFGGAFSNHIAAVAYAGKEYRFETIGIIRGKELEATWCDNPTLNVAYANGMQLVFVSRAEYRHKDSPGFLDTLYTRFGNFYHLPEGGTNALAVKGCGEILGPTDTGFDVICCSVGTGGTLAGLINSALPHQTVLGFPALKGDFLYDDIRKFTRNPNWELCQDYHFGGYAKVDRRLIGFINRFKQDTGIPLDAVYTGKMMFGLMDAIQNDRFPPGTKILAIHTGGLQGNMGMNRLLARKGLPQIRL